MLFGDTVAFGESLTLIHEYAEESSHASSSDSHFLASTGDENYFAWQDQEPATPDVVDLYYDYRPIDAYANFITAEQQVAAETAMAGWVIAADAKISFTRSESAPLDAIINIGVGDLAALGYVSEPEGVLALGGGTVTHDENHTITAGIVWLDFAETWDTTFGNEDPSGTFDAFTVFAHEIGHALGLGHTDDLPQLDIMDGVYNGEKTTFSTNDQTLIQVLYGDGSTDDIPLIGPRELSDSDTVLAADQVYNDDLIVYGSECVGFDCSNGENFSFDTLRLKENNLRVHFDDTSNSASFPSNDWRIRINDTANGGGNYFAIEDSTGGRTPFRIDAGAPNHSLFVESSGDVGFGTNNPAVALHSADGDTPTLRLEQNGTSGWSPQTWDMAGNETNFFIRDVTNGSKLPFRIRPNAPQNSLFVDADGSIGVGTSSPSEALHVRRTNGTARILVVEASTTTGDRELLRLKNNGAAYMALEDTDAAREWLTGAFAGDDTFFISLSGTGGSDFEIFADGRVQMGPGLADTFDLATNGNLTISGTLTQGSSRSIKEDFEAWDTEDLLAKLRALPVTEWNYISDGDSVRHVGPIAEDFYATFGLGADAQHIAPGDLAGVTIAGINGLHDVIEHQNEQIAYLSSLLGDTDALAFAEQTSQDAAAVAAWLTDLYQSPTDAGAAVSTGVPSPPPASTGPVATYYAVVPTGQGDAGQAGMDSGRQQYALVQVPVDQAEAYALAASTLGTRPIATAALPPTPDQSAVLTGAGATLAAQQVLAADQVFVDDLIVRGSQCVGVDCVNGENFGSDTFRLKENNLRMVFVDTSSTASFPNRDWQIRANDSSNGGDSFLSIDDLGHCG